MTIYYNKQIITGCERPYPQNFENEILFKTYLKSFNSYIASLPASQKIPMPNVPDDWKDGRPVQEGLDFTTGPDKDFIHTAYAVPVIKPEENTVYGECSKHPGNNMVNCIYCKNTHPSVHGEGQPISRHQENGVQGEGKTATAMQELIADIDEEISYVRTCIEKLSDKIIEEKEKKIGLIHRLICLKDNKRWATKKLELEKQQIIDARTDGIIRGHKVSCEDYYNNKFNQ